MLLVNRHQSRSAMNFATWELMSAAPLSEPHLNRENRGLSEIGLLCSPLLYTEHKPGMTKFRVLLHDCCEEGPWEMENKRNQNTHVYQLFAAHDILVTESSKARPLIILAHYGQYGFIRPTTVSLGNQLVHAAFGPGTMQLLYPPDELTPQ